MKKGNYYKFIWWLSLLLVLVFFIMLVLDYCKYNSYTTSAPFYTFVIVRAFEFLLPSIVLFVIGIFCKRKFTK